MGTNSVLSWKLPESGENHFCDFWLPLRIFNGRQLPLFTRLGHRKVHPEADFSGELSVIVLFQNRNFAYKSSYKFPKCENVVPVESALETFRI